MKKPEIEQKTTPSIVFDYCFNSTVIVLFDEYINVDNRNAGVGE